ncbi:hypothetical protein [Umezawaea sp.]|uniref:hypothetical protein n=1 Tax=Umezawaea sp. TaxID=1955258 RepID=UPI002ED4F62A
MTLTPHRRETLAVIRPRGDLLVLHTLLWAEDIRDPGFTLPTGSRAGQREIHAAVMVINSMTTKTDHDNPPPESPPPGSGSPPPGSPGSDLLTALHHSLEQPRTHQPPTPPHRPGQRPDQ